MEDVGAAPEPVQGEPVQAAAEDDVKLSKRAMRKAKRHTQWEERKANKKLKRQQQQRLKKASGEIPPPKELDMSEEAVLRRRERASAKRETFLMAAEEGVKVVIDCQFEEEMTEKEKKSLSQQIMCVLRRGGWSMSSMRIYSLDVGGVGVCFGAMAQVLNLEKIAGFHDWQAVSLVLHHFGSRSFCYSSERAYLQFTGSSKSYINVFKKESLVYLTADSPNTITKLSRDKVYIIGGIVDRNRLKGITYDKAVEQGIETAKLPLDAVVEMGSATRVLTVNHGASHISAALLLQLFGSERLGTGDNVNASIAQRRSFEAGVTKNP
ncbi:unnamed protein product [Phytophthora fragariaefolia]|uniref:tRNA (guanine(9)-N(1))-methyltransferase n=1 Tax=Phytophthora fragariaefolia TaxID=1490495 RepID=A0A9W6XBN0_9STRA|nr:unnamed protein product [Phytophthora fragariaefolia]